MIAEKHEEIMKYCSIAKTFNPLTRVKRGGGILIDHAFLGFLFSHLERFALTAYTVQLYVTRVFRKNTAPRPDCENLRTADR